jgi:hypothetical protein
MSLAEHIEGLATLARRPHYGCEDSWYSCPKHPEGCANGEAGEDCNCGADKHNAEVGRAAAAALRIEHRAAACLRWASTLAIAVRGGWPANEMQQVLSAAARGDDWEGVRDELLLRRGHKKSHRGSP